jgi:hypothetical protein
VRCRLSFDRAMSDCKAVILRIMGLTFHPDMPKARKAHILHHLRGNGYII